MHIETREETKRSEVIRLKETIGVERKGWNFFKKILLSNMSLKSLRYSDYFCHGKIKHNTNLPNSEHVSKIYSQYIVN